MRFIFCTTYKYTFGLLLFVDIFIIADEEENQHALKLHRFVWRWYVVWFRSASLFLKRYEICKTILTHWYWTGWLNKCCWRGKPRWHGLVDSLRMWWNLYWQNLKTFVVQNQGAWQRHLPLGDPDHGCFRRSPQQWTLITQEQSKV